VSQASQLSRSVLVWLKVGCLGFGGPAGQIALLHREVVERRGWIDEARFAHALSFCMLLPGPEAQQLATWLGWRLHGVRGGIAAGLLFVLPGLLVMLGLSALYVAHGRAAWAGPVLLGLKAAVVALVLQALIRMGGRAIKSAAGWWAAGLAFAALTFTVLPFPLIILAAGAAGWALGGGVVATRAFAEKGRGATPWRPAWSAWRSGWRRCCWPWHRARTRPWPGWAGCSACLAVVSFGGAYAALAYLGQAASRSAGWRRARCWTAWAWPRPRRGRWCWCWSSSVSSAPISRRAGRSGPGSPPWPAGLMAAWTTFAPSFLWIFAGGPFFERLRSRPGPPAPWPWCRRPPSG
jgi:chromate transporter